MVSYDMESGLACSTCPDEVDGASVGFQEKFLSQEPLKQESITKKFSNRKPRIALPEVAMRHALRALVRKQKTERPKTVLTYLKFRTTLRSEGHFLYEFYDWVCRYYTVDVSMFKKFRLRCG